MKPLNSYIVCEEVEESLDNTNSGFSFKTQERFKKLKVIASSDADVKVDDLVKVPFASGEPDENFFIIKRSDIIYII